MQMITRPSAFKLEYLKNEKRFVKTVKTLINIKQLFGLFNICPL